MLPILSALSFSAVYSPNEERSFLAWMRESSHIFVGDDYSFRLGVFISNLRYINEYNLVHDFKLGPTSLAHLTKAEYDSMLGYKYIEKPVMESLPRKKKVADVPDSLDYREKGVVNPIKDQGQCGSCWSFSSVQAMESQWALQKGILLSLSEKNLIDCVIDCLGCHGCFPAIAYSYIIAIQKGKFMLESDYPYEPSRGSCHFDSSKAVCHLKGYLTAKHFKEDDLKSDVATYGPASVLIDASKNSFQLYCSGIYDEPSCSTIILDHCVGVIGYGSENGVDFWLIRNSWGPYWGENGYMRLRRNHNNMCGISTESVIPQVD